MNQKKSFWGVLPQGVVPLGTPAQWLIWGPHQAYHSNLSPNTQIHPNSPTQWLIWGPHQAYHSNLSPNTQGPCYLLSNCFCPASHPPPSLKFCLLVCLNFFGRITPTQISRFSHFVFLSMITETLVVNGFYIISVIIHKQCQTRTVEILVLLFF